MALNCDRCFKTIESTRFLICSTCKFTFHIDCCNVSEKRFYLMEAVKRAAWKCSSCLRNVITASENVTVRQKYKANISTENSFEALSCLSCDEEEIENQSFESDKKNRSCPELSANNHARVEEMEKIILDLKEKLKIADNEIENLLAENYSLKEKIARSDNKVDLLKSVCKSSPHNRSLRKNRKCLNSRRLDFTKNDECNFKDQPSISTPIHPAPATASIDVQTPKKAGPKITKPTVYIFGDQQARGLAERLIKTRMGKWNDIYSVTSVLKPHASSDQILSSLKSLENIITKEDIVVLSVGSNDKNPYLLFTELCNTLFKFKDHTILLLNVGYNRNLNIDMLNSKLKLIVQNYVNCEFIEVDRETSFSKNYVLQLMSFKLNVEIDFLKYKRDYIENVNKFKNLNDVDDMHCKSNDMQDNRFFRP